MVIQPAGTGAVGPELDPPVSEVPETAPHDLAQSSVRGFLWTTLAWGSNRLVILGLTLVLARLLTPDDFGIVTAALTIITMFDAALDLGVGASVVANQERGITHRIRTAFTLNLGLSAGLAAVGVALSPLIAGLFDAREQAGLFALIFLYPLFRGAGQVHDAVLKRDLRFRRRTVIDLLRATARVSVSIPLALTVGGPISIAAGILASELLAMLTLWILVPIVPALRLKRIDVAELLSFGGQVTVIRILGSFRSAFDYLVVGAMISTTALGFYGMAYKLPELGIENVLWIVSAVALPTYARAHAVGHEVMLRAMLRATRLLALYGLAAGTALAVVARDAVPVLFSEQWTPAVVPMMLISISLGIMSIAWASGDVFSAMGRPGTLIMLDLPATALMAAGFVFSAQYGLVAVALVHLVFNVLYCAARMVLVIRITNVSTRSLAEAVVPGVLVAATTAAAGFGASALLPGGEVVSLAAVSAVCGISIIGASVLFARPAVVEMLAMLGARRRGRAPSPHRAPKEGRS